MARRRKKLRSDFSARALHIRFRVVSACDWGISEPLAAAKTAKLALARGIAERFAWQPHPEGADPIITTMKPRSLQRGCQPFSHGILISIKRAHRQSC